MPTVEFVLESQLRKMKTENLRLHLFTTCNFSNCTWEAYRNDKTQMVQIKPLYDVHFAQLMCESISIQ